MASPQIEDGYIRIANELLDVLCQTHLGSGSANHRVLFAIIRKTYGWNKKRDNISISQICQATGLSKRMVIYALQDLEAKNLIIVDRVTSGGEKQPSQIMLNKNYDTWVVQNFAPQTEQNRAKAKARNILNRSAKLCTTGGGSAKHCTDVVQNSVKKVRCFAHTKDTNTKDNTKDKNPLTPLPEIPACVDAQIWDDFKEHRKALNSKMTPQSQKMTLKKLERFHMAGQDPNEILNQSMENGWKGVFELKNTNGSKPSGILTEKGMRNAAITESWLRRQKGENARP